MQYVFQTVKTKNGRKALTENCQTLKFQLKARQIKLFKVDLQLQEEERPTYLMQGDSVTLLTIQ